jgi:hypothetical protein
MTDYPGAPEQMKDWKPYHHIDRACELLTMAEEDRETPEKIVRLAQAHLAVAQAKMFGRQRA